MGPATFGWQGLLFEHDPEWAPTTVSGDRNQGYVKVSGPESGFLQVRWEKGRKRHLDLVLATYLRKVLRSSCVPDPKFSTKPRGDELHYRYDVGVKAIGALWQPEKFGGVVFLEAVNVSRRLFKLTKDSFTIQTDALERWSLHGLDVMLPRALKLDAHEMRAGKTTIHLSGARMRVVAERWGLADQLLKSRTLEQWVSALVGFRLSPCLIESNRVALERNSRVLPSTWVKAVVQAHLNQIVVLRVDSRDSASQPQWNWFV